MDTFIEDLIEEAGSSYDVVVAAAKRAKQLREGARPLVDIKANNPLTIALHEIAAGKIILADNAEIPAEDSQAAATIDYLERRGDIAELADEDEPEEDSKEE